MASTQARFRRPVKWPDRLLVGARVITINTYSATPERLAREGAVFDGQGVRLSWYDLKRKAEALEEMRRSLEHLAASCHGDDRPDCPILDDLASEAPTQRTL